MAGYIRKVRQIPRPSRTHAPARDDSAIRAVLLILLQLSGCGGGETSEQSARTGAAARPSRVVQVGPAAAAPLRPCSSLAQGPYAVLRVSDGDTIVVRQSGRATTVRLIGVDAPEVEGPYRKREPGGSQSKAFVESLISRRDVFLESDPAQSPGDRYGRRLAYVYRAGDCLLVNGEIIRQGFGESYHRFRFRNHDLFERYEQEARRGHLGLWR